MADQNPELGLDSSLEVGSSLNNDDISTASTSAAASKLVISPEARARIEKNRLAAQKRLKEKSELLKQGSQDGLNSTDDDIVVPAKRRKKESQFMTELKDVVSEGSIVRVQGTKLIDTGGGFLIEEKDLIEQEEAEKVIVPHEAPYIPTDVPRCIECKNEFQDSFLFKTYEYPVCDKCKDTDEKHKLITRTDAKNDYLLKDVDLDKREPMLKFMIKPNPHNSRWGDMKLYLKLQVKIYTKACIFGL